ncbi:MAG: phosphoribosyl-AMP cyclohydrolase [Rhodovibrionaceae bacterium]
MSDPLFGERGSREQVERGLVFAPKFDAEGLIPAIAVCVDSGEVVMQAYMNRDALAKTVETGEAHYWSRSRGALWHKGATSGHVQKVKELRVDCDQDCLLLKVEVLGPGSCHLGYPSCFHRAVVLEGGREGPLALRFAEERSYDPDAVYGGGPDKA